MVSLFQTLNNFADESADLFQIYAANGFNFFSSCHVTTER